VHLFSSANLADENDGSIFVGFGADENTGHAKKTAAYIIAIIKPNQP
jgi:hypothetical protein